MPNPTDSIFLPYHALDNVILRGTRAAQPVATAVTPGSVYCVSNEGNKLERSTGLVWEAFSPTADGGIPGVHHTSHEPGGSDALTVNAAAGVGSLRSLGTTALTAAAGNDGRFSDARTPTAHRVTHETGGSDPIAALSAAVLTSGTVPDARFPATLPAVSGANLTNLNASNLASGSVPAGRLPANVALTDAANTFAVELDVTGGSSTPYYSAPIEIRMASHPRVGFHWPGVVASQIGMDSTGTVRTYDNPGTGYERFAALYFFEQARGVPMGYWAAVPFAAGNFVAGSPMTWTVGSGNIANNRYSLVGKTLTWSLQIANSTFSGTVSNNVVVVLPAGLLAAAAGNMTFKYNSAGIWAHGDVQWAASGNTIQLVKADFSNFALGAFYAYLTVVLEVL